jgi:hypothetical protein
MTTTEILEEPNEEFPNITPVKEHMGIDIPPLILDSNFNLIKYINCQYIITLYKNTFKYVK